jgi:hypothetical protein
MIFDPMYLLFIAPGLALSLWASFRVKRTFNKCWQEQQGVAKVLNAAALTYVAAAVSSLLTLLYFLMRSGLLGGRR